MTPEEKADAVVAALNEAFRRDPAAIATVMSIRATCNLALAEDDHVTVRPEEPDGPGQEDVFSVGPLGLINAALSVLDVPRVAMQIDDECQLVKFVRFRGPAPDETIL